MNKYLGFIFAVVVSLGTSGCGQSGSPTGSSSPSANQDTLGTITQTVKEFWEAVRTGQDSTQLLTPAARQCIVENGYEFSPPASENARYTIGAAELIDADKAIVESVWTDIDGDGQPHDNNITIALKLVDGRWWVSGMAADLGPDQPPFVMNLEDPAEFYGPSTVASPAQSAPAVRQAQQPPSDPFQQPLAR